MQRLRIVTFLYTLIICVALSAGCAGSALADSNQASASLSDASNTSNAYAAKASAVMNYIQRKYWDEKEGLYRNDAPPDSKLRWATMWTCGVQFSALVGAARHDYKTYVPIIERFFETMNCRYWSADLPFAGFCAYPGGWKDRYYDDNAWMVITFAQAYEATRDPAYLARAEKAFDFVMSGWDDQLGGGIYWRVDKRTKNTCSNAPSAVAALTLARLCAVDAKEKYLQQAVAIVKWTQEDLQSPEGLYWDHISLDGNIEKKQWTYNTALMIRANLLLYLATREHPYLSEAKKLGRASSRFIDPQRHAYRDGSRFAHLLVEANLELYRETRDESLLREAQQTADYFWNRWLKNKDGELIENASIARMLWLMADL